MVRRVALCRYALLALGEQLQRRGVCADRTDPFFLRIEELHWLLDPARVPEARARITRRRAAYEHHLTLEPPTVVKGRYDPAQHPPDQVDAGLTSLTGVPVNPGVVTAPARVILRAGADQVRPGEVLVAPYTDPGWTPCFLNAAALVTDLGGLLSHGSIVAREYGLPAVVNTLHATRRIRTGMLVTVDGGRGTVTLPAADA
jgi:pyruvate,water dikinase